MTDRQRRWLVAILLIAGSFLRLYRLDKYPLGIHQDELSNIYDGWSIATTGYDRFGDHYPAVVRAFGERDYRPALYPWLAAASESVLGFSITSGRLPAAIFGIATMILVFAFAREVFGRDPALLVLFLFALQPLAIQLSRLAHEANSLPGFFLISVLYLWQRAAKKEYPIPLVGLLGLVLGLSTNVYQSTRLTGALIGIVIVIDLFLHSRRRFQTIATFGIGAVAGALPQLIFLITQPARFAGRAKVLGIEAHGPVSYVIEFLRSFFINLSPRYLFIPPYLRGLTIARLIPAEILFFYIGLAAFAFMPVRTAFRARPYMYALVAILILPSAITNDPPATMRTSAITVLLPFFTAAGIVYVARFVRDEVKRRRIYYPAVVGIILIAWFAVTYRYSRSEYFRELSFQELGVRMGKALGRHAGDYDAVIVGPQISQAYLYIAAFSPITPAEYHRLPKRLYSIGMDRYTQVGKYHFVTESMMDRSIASLRGHGRVLFVTPQKVPELAVVDSVRFRNDALYFGTWR